MRILVIAHAYPPFNSPRAIRWSAILRQWVAEGHAVDVLTARGAGLPREECLDGVRVRRVGSSLGDALRRRLAPEGSSAGAGTAPSRERAALSPRRLAGLTLRWINRHVWHNLHWPDGECLWYRPARRAARAWLREADHQALVTVALPFTSHLIGAALRRDHPRLPWLADYGDPFCFCTACRSNNQRLYRALNHRAERQVLARAHRMVVTTEGTRARYAALFPELAERMHVIPPLAAPPPTTGASAPFPADGRIRLVFLGTLYARLRNPAYLLQLFAALLASPVGERLELHFYGKMNDTGPCFAPYGALLGERIHQHGLVSPAQAQAVANAADILVNIGNDTLFQLPSKVVEYAATGRPVLTLATRAEDTSAAFFQHYPQALCLVAGAAPLAAQARQVQQFITTAAPIPAERLAAWMAPYTVAAVARNYLHLLQDVARGHGHG